MKAKSRLTECFQGLACVFTCKYIKKQHNVVVRWLRKDMTKLRNDKDGEGPVVFSSDAQFNIRAVLPLMPSKTV